MGVPSWLGKILGKGTGDLITSIGDTAKKFITTEADRQAFEMALQKAALDAKRLEMEAEQMYFQDRSSARDMYKHDNSLQKIFAITFLVGYIALTVVMLYLLVGWIGAKAIEIPDWAVALLSSIYGALSAKVGTITDFLFGSSQGSREKDELKLINKKED
jgi:hypothetical protein